MKIEKAVFDASPLILLFKSGRADLLPRLFAEIVVPEAVWEEVMAGGKSDIAAAGVSSAAWIQRVKTPGTAPQVVTRNLGGGESEVLTFALTHPDYVAVIDDYAARSCARTLGRADARNGWRIGSGEKARPDFLRVR